MLLEADTASMFIYIIGVTQRALSLCNFNMTTVVAIIVIATLWLVTNGYSSTLCKRYGNGILPAVAAAGAISRNECLGAGEVFSRHVSDLQRALSYCDAYWSVYGYAYP